MFAFPFTCVFTLAFASISVGGIAKRSSTRIPSIFRPLSGFATILARVDVCRAGVGRAGRAISSLVLVFNFALSLTFLERVTSKVSTGVTPLQQGYAKSCAVGIGTQLQTVSKKNRGQIHHHCVLDCVLPTPFLKHVPTL